MFIVNMHFNCSCILNLTYFNFFYCAVKIHLDLPICIPPALLFVHSSISTFPSGAAFLLSKELPLFFWGRSAAHKFSLFLFVYKVNSSLVLMDILTEYRILDWRVFSFSDFKGVIPLALGLHHFHWEISRQSYCCIYEIICLF